MMNNITVSSGDNSEDTMLLSLSMTGLQTVGMEKVVLGEIVNWPEQSDIEKGN